MTIAARRLQTRSRPWAGLWRSRPESYCVERIRRSPSLNLGALAGVGGALIFLPSLPAVWLMSWSYAALFALLGVAQLGLVTLLLVRPTRASAGLAIAAAGGVILFWALARVVRVIPDPDPWVPVNAVIGFTDDLCAILETASVVGLAYGAMRRPRERVSLSRRVLTAVVLVPIVAILTLIGLLGVIASTDGLAGAGFPAGAVDPGHLPAGQMSTVEYCRPEGVPLAMDLYMPAGGDRGGTAAPVALYVHGGGVWGDRKTTGPGATLANHAGALFGPVRERLNGRGFVVASIDYRLPPGTPWPAQIEDTKCAVRFLRARALDLGVDAGRIGVWGSSGGGVLASLLGLTAPQAGFDVGQYLDQSSDVQAVVDMFGPADLNEPGDPGPFFRFVLQAAFGDSEADRRAASPMTYVAPGGPPFLILQGTEDPMNRTHQSEAFFHALEASGVAAGFIDVTWAGHGLNYPGQEPSADELATTVVDFFSATLQ